MKTYIEKREKEFEHKFSIPMTDELKSFHKESMEGVVEEVKDWLDTTEKHRTIRTWDKKGREMVLISDLKEFLSTLSNQK